MVDNTVSDSEIPAGGNVQMKGRLIILRKLKMLGQISLPPKKLKQLEKKKIQTNPACKNRNKTNFKYKQVRQLATIFGTFFEIQQLFCNFKNKIAIF